MIYFAGINVDNSMLGEGFLQLGDSLKLYSEHMCPEGRRIPPILSQGSQDLSNLILMQRKLHPSEGISSLYRSLNNLKKNRRLSV